MLSAVAITASRVSRCLERIATISVPPPALCLGVNGRGTAATVPRALFALEVCASIVKLTVSFHLNAHCTQDETDREQPRLTPIQTGGQFASHPSSFSV